MFEVTVKLESNLHVWPVNIFYTFYTAVYLKQAPCMP